MIEIFYVFNSDPPTFFLAVHLFDLYIWMSNIKIANNDLHLIGITCIYLASKMEDIIPLRMSHLKSKIGHNKFSEKEIKKNEKILIIAIDFQLISTSTYDFIKAFIFDFCYNNRGFITSLNMNRHIENLENICIYLAKMMCHSDEFSSYKYSLKAIVSIIVAFDILKSNSKNFDKNAEVFMSDWVRIFLFILQIFFLIKESQIDINIINEVYDELFNYYHKYDTMKFINFNLNRTHNLEFD